jgi:hypothetical protein
LSEIATDSIRAWQNNSLCGFGGLLGCDVRSGVLLVFRFHSCGLFLPFLKARYVLVYGNLGLNNAIMDSSKKSLK